MVGGVLVLQGGCATAPKREERSEALSTRKVGVAPKSFWPEKGETVVIRWTQTQEAKITLEIHREDGALMRHFETLSPAGDHTFRWDGKDEEGTPVPAGVYLYSLRSQGENGRETVYDPSLTMGGEELKIERFTFDKEKRQFDFILPRAGRARLRIGLTPFMHLRTLLNWEPMEAGSHTLIWDGLDASNWIRAVDHPNLSVNLAAFALPDNAIIARGTHEESSTFPGAANRRPPKSGLYLHALHDPAQCRDIFLQVEFPGSEENDEGLPILDGKTIVRTRLEEKDKNFMVNQRFEIIFSVDTVLLFEEEEGQDPFNFEWDTTGLAPGEHLLTVNLIGYDDHYGVKTVRVVKKGTP